MYDVIQFILSLSIHKVIGFCTAVITPFRFKDATKLKIRIPKQFVKEQYDCFHYIVASSLMI